jgi:hypothetical protein
MNASNKKVKEVLSKARHDDARKGKELNITVNLPSVGEVYLSTIFRVIKGKRIACLGKTGTQNIFVKIYFAPFKSGIHYRRSLRGTLHFINNSIITPELIFSGFCPEYNFHVIIQEFIVNAKTIGEVFWNKEKISDRNDLIDSLMVCLAKHHERGIIQNDLQMGNFLVSEHKLFSLDGDQVIDKKRPVNKSEAIANLSAYFYNLPVEFLNHLPRFFETYCQHRNWNSSKNDIILLTNNIYKRRKCRIKKYLKKVFKSKDPFKVKKNRNYFSVRNLKNWHTDYSEILDNPFQFFPEEEKEIGLKGSFDFEIESTKLYISFERINPLLRFFKKDSISKKWCRTIQKNIQGDTSITPIALINIKKQGKWFGFIVEEKPASQDNCKTTAS